MRDYVFLLVTSSKCGFCIKFREQIWSSLYSELSKDERLIIKVVDCLTRVVDLPGSTPKILTHYIYAFPTILMVPKHQWVDKHLEKLDVQVYGSFYKFVDGLPKLKYRDPEMNIMDTVKIKQWVDDVIKGKIKLPKIEKKLPTIEDLNSGKTLFKW